MVAEATQFAFCAPTMSRTRHAVAVTARHVVTMSYQHAAPADAERIDRDRLVWDLEYRSDVRRQLAAAECAHASSVADPIHSTND